MPWQLALVVKFSMIKGCEILLIWSFQPNTWMRFLYLLLFLLFCWPLFGQYEDMLHKPYYERLEEISKLHKEAYGQKDSSTTVAFLTEFKNWARQNNDETLALEADLIMGLYYRRFYRHNPQTGEHLLNLSEKAIERELPFLEVRAVASLSLYYWQNKEYERAFKWLMHCSRNLDKIDVDAFPQSANYLNRIGKCYYFFKDYRRALTYFERCASLKRATYNHPYIADAYNTMGLCYQKLGDLEASTKQFLKITQDTSQFSSPVWKAIAHGNIGYNYYLQGDYERAIPLLKVDVESALEGKVDYGLAAGSTTALADIYLKENRMEEAKQEIDSARHYIAISGQTSRFRNLYPVMSQWFAQNNQADSSTIYFDSTMAIIKRNDETFNSLKILRANQAFSARERELEVAQLRAESQLKILQRNTVIFIVIILLSGSIIAYLFRNKYLLKKQQVNDLALKSAKGDLKRAKEQLESMVKRVHDNNEMITRLSKGRPKEDESALLEELRSKSILTREDWIEYQDLFKKTYPNFMPQLKTAYPDLTPAEIRCLCLEKLEMSNNEKALVLGVSANTVVVTKHRIRKKLGLETQDGLKELVEGLG